MNEQNHVPTILAVSCQKGGEGKTTSAWHIGAALTQRGYKVCLRYYVPTVISRRMTRARNFRRNECVHKFFLKKIGSGSAHALVGYNLCSFDLPFMEASGICCPDTAVCDVMLDYAFVNHEWDDGYGDWKWQKLTACAANYNYPYQAHNSLEDARATLYCARKVAESMVAINQAFQRMSDPAIQP